MKRKLIPILLTAALATLTACAADAQPMQTVSPTMPATQAPMTLPGTNDGMGTDGMGTDGAGTDGTLTPGGTTTGEPGMGTGAPEAQGVTSVTNARKAMEQIEDELERLSEVTDAQVVVAGNTAAVALQFDKQYQGGIDERLEKMVQERIKGVVSGITNVAVTQDTNVFDQLDKLGERMETASDMAAIQSDLDALVSRIKSKA